MNIYDIAAEAGVSISTVSRVMNHKGNVNPEMKKRIEEVLEKYDYKPSAIARGMVSKTMKTIAVLATDVRIPQFAGQVYGIEQEFSRAGYNVMVCNTGENLEDCAKYINMLSQKQVDGIIAIGSAFGNLKDNPDITGKMRWSPVVMANGKIDLPNFYSVLLDEAAGIRKAAELLQSRGKKNIYLACRPDTDSGIRKKEGFLRAIKDMGIAGGEDRILFCGYGMEEGARIVSQLKESGRPFDGLIFGGDITAAGAMKELLQRGYRIPQDAAVISWGNSVSALTCWPELTAVDIRAEEMGRLCAKTLHGLLENQELQRIQMIEPELIVRESV